jgi:hypothetical protein
MGAEYAEPRMREAVFRIRMARMGKDLVVGASRVCGLGWEVVGK